MGTPSVSVVIAVHNGERFLPATLDSLLAQTHPNFEVLCVDDASTDGSLGLLQKYAERDPRVRVVKIEANLGTVPRVLNFALPLVRGDFFAYSSQDDLFSPDWLAKMHARAIEVEADAVLPDVVFLRDHADTSTRLCGLRGDRSIILDGRQAVEYSLDWTITGFALWRRSVIGSAGFETFTMNSDEYSVRVFYFACRRVAFCDGVFYYSQNNPNAISRKISVGLFDIPLTHLRLFDFLVRHDFRADLLSSQFERTVSSLWWLGQQLEMGGSNLMPQLRGRALAKLKEVHEQLQAARYSARIKAGRGAARLKAIGVRTPFPVFHQLVRLAAQGRTLTAWLGQVLQ